MSHNPLKLKPNTHAKSHLFIQVASLLASIEVLLTKSIAVITTFLFSGAVLLYTLQVGLRIFFRSSIIWIDPMIGYLFAVSALWGSALACQHNENIKIEIFKYLYKYRLLPIVVDGFSFLVTVLIIYIFSLHFGQVGTDLTMISRAQWKDIPYLLIFFSSLFFYGSRILRLIITNPKAT